MPSKNNELQSESAEFREKIAALDAKLTEDSTPNLWCLRFCREKL